MRGSGPLVRQAGGIYLTPQMEFKHAWDMTPSAQTLGSVFFSPNNLNNKTTTTANNNLEPPTSPLTGSLTTHRSQTARSLQQAKEIRTAVYKTRQLAQTLRDRLMSQPLSHHLSRPLSTARINPRLCVKEELLILHTFIVRVTPIRSILRVPQQTAGAER